MTENEDLINEIERLKREIEELKGAQKKDEGILRALQWLNIGEAKAKAYIYLVKKGRATAEEVAEGAGLYPTTAREVLASLLKSGIVKREKLETDSTGRKPFVYTALPPSELLKNRAHHIEQTLSELLRLEFLVRDGEISVKAPLLPIRIEIKSLRRERKRTEEERERTEEEGENK